MRSPLGSLLRDDVAPGVAARVGALASLLVATFAAGAAVVLAGHGGPGTDTTAEQVALIAPMAVAAVLAATRPLRVDRNRLPWALQAVGIGCYATGFVAWYAGLGRELSSLLWAAFYPLAYACGALLIRSWARDIRSPALLDGVIAGCGAAALVAALFLRPLTDFATDGADVILAYTYPLVDVILLATVLVGAAVARAVPDRAWILAGLCFAALFAGDMGDLVQVDERAGGLAYPTVPAVLWMGGMALLAFAAWQPEREVRLEARDWLSWSTLAVPACFVTSSVVLLLLLDITERPVVTALAAATVLAAVVRTVLMYGELRKATATNRIVMTDDLTGLATRRGLTLRVADELADARRGDEPLAIVTLDIDGFGAVTGALGARAGDEVL
ncbi:MAG TPA: diguanylate cyclase, partial [Solirubrobacteraceae bacterium]|nr:diguanylate cyclase [Solirubrobacteraceae bacterium]